jgi:hypothetical protein
MDNASHIDPFTSLSVQQEEMIEIMEEDETLSAEFAALVEALKSRDDRGIRKASRQLERAVDVRWRAEGFDPALSRARRRLYLRDAHEISRIFGRRGEAEFVRAWLETLRSVKASAAHVLTHIVDRVELRRRRERARDAADRDHLLHLAFPPLRVAQTRFAAMASLAA